MNGSAITERPTAGTAAVRSMTLIDQLAGAVDLAESALRNNEPDALHRLRTVVRRLRSVLASTRRLFEDGATDDLRARLKAFGAILGEARDLEVSADRAERMLHDLPAELHDEDAVRRLVAGIRDDSGEALDRVLEYLDGDEHGQLLTRLVAFRSVAIASERGASDAAQQFGKIARSERRRVTKRATFLHVQDAASGEIMSSPGILAQLHELRKSARRLRYFIEAVTEDAPESAGKRFSRYAAAAERIQNAIGEHRDAVLFSEALLLEASRAHRLGEKTLTYGVLYEQAREGARRSLDDLLPALDDI